MVPLENVNESMPPHVSSTSTSSNSVLKEPLPEHCSCGRGSAKIEENSVIKYQMETRASVSTTIPWLVVPTDVNVLIVGTLMAVSRLPSRHAHTNSS